MWDQSQTLPQWLEIRPKLALLFGKMFAQFRKRRIIQSWFQNVFWNQCCDVVHNLPWHFAFSNLYAFHSILLVRSSQIGFKMYTFEVFMWSSLWDAFCGEQKFTPVNGAQWTPIYMAQHKLLKMRGLSYLVHPHFTKSHTNLFKTCHMPHAWPYGASVPWYHHDDYVTQNWPIRTELTSEHRAWLFVTNWSVIWRPGNSGFDRRQTPFPAATPVWQKCCQNTCNTAANRRNNYKITKVGLFCCLHVS